MRNVLLLTCFFLSFCKCLSAQYITKSTGFTGGGVTSKYTSIGLGYSFITGGYYRVNKESPLKSKNFYNIFESQLYYAPSGNFYTLKISNSISFEARRWNTILFGLNCGLDLALQSNFSSNEYQINPKLGLTFFHGTIELAYSRNLLDNGKRNFSNANIFTFTIRPYIFIKSQKEKWNTYK